MRTPPPYRLPVEKQKQLQRAERLEWVTIFFLITIAGVMYLATGSSQAMKTAWLEDVLSLVPPIVFLVALRFRTKPPNEQFPYGYRRLISVAFLSAATALLIMGLYMLYDSAMKLIMQEHPTIGLREIWGWQLWSGWIMIAALIYSAIPPVILGKKKVPLAKKLHEKTLHTDAAMNKDDWLTALAAMVGVLGVGFGWWWADAVAAGVISVQVVKDGYENVTDSITDLIGQRPTRVGQGDEPELAPLQLVDRLKDLDWVEDATVRLREEGDVFTGEAYIIPRYDHHLLEHLRQAYQVIHTGDWRLYDIAVVPVATFEEAWSDPANDRGDHSTRPEKVSEKPAV